MTDQGDYEKMTADFAVVLTPPSDQKRRENEFTEGASEKLSAAFKEIFGRWPSMS